MDFKDLSALAKWLNQPNEHGKTKFCHILANASIYGNYDSNINGIIDVLTKVFYTLYRKYCNFFQTFEYSKDRSSFYVFLPHGNVEVLPQGDFPITMGNSVTGEKLRIERHINNNFGQVKIRRLPMNASEWDRTVEQMLDQMQEDNKVPVIFCKLK